MRLLFASLLFCLCIPAVWAVGANMPKPDIGKGGQCVDGKSIMQMTMLAANRGTQLKIVAVGSDAEVVRLRYGIEPGGNAPHDPHGEFGAKNILYTARSIDEIAAATGSAASMSATA